MPILKILTCVTNGGGYGPGHTALVIGQTVWSFEQLVGITGWKKFAVSDYMAANAERPVILQTLNEKVDGQQVLDWLKWDEWKPWNKYGPNVCSQRASSALAEGASSGFDPKGYDTPYGVYWHAWDKTYVQVEKCVWASQGSGDKKDRIAAKLKADYQFDLSDVVTS